MADEEVEEGIKSSMGKFHDWLKRMRVYNELWSILLVVFGIFLLRDASAVLNIVFRIIGAAFLIYGVFRVVSSLTVKGAPGFVTSFSIILGVMLSAIGVFFLANPGMVKKFADVLFALLMLAQGINAIIETRNLHSYSDPKWYLVLIDSIVTILLAVLILFHPGKLADVIMQLAGIAMIFAGISGILFSGRSARYESKARKAAENVIDGDAEILGDDDDGDGQNW